MLFCLAHRNKVRPSWSVYPHDKNHLTMQHAQTLHPAFTVILPRVFFGNHGQIKNGFTVSKIYLMVLYVEFPFVFIPCIHDLIVYTEKPTDASGVLLKCGADFSGIE
jgi:hypothetical protein